MTAQPSDPELEDAPIIPGIRYRIEKRTRMVPVTIDGVTEDVEEEYRVRVPVPPRDWDTTLQRGVLGLALVFTTISAAWTTAGIGQLLATTIVAVIAYGAALVFDGLWIGCLILEWLDRYDPQRAKTAKVTGWVALGLAMVAVVVHGAHHDQLAAGLVGATVSAAAKGLWVLVLRRYAVPLSDTVSGWLNQRRQKITVKQALSAELLRLHRQEMRTAALYGMTPAAARAITATGVPNEQQDSVPAGQDTEPEIQDTGQDPPAQPAQPPVPPHPAAVADQATGPYHKPATAAAEQQAGNRVVTTASVSKPDIARQDTVSHPSRCPAPDGPSIRDTILTALRDGISEDDRPALRAHVQEVHGDVPADTFRKSRLRAIQDFHEGEGTYP